MFKQVLILIALLVLVSFQMIADPAYVSNISSSAYEFGAATKYCDDLDENSNTNWSMPSLEEFVALSGQYNNNTSELYWTKTLSGSVQGGESFYKYDPKLGVVKLKTYESGGFKVRCVH